MEFAFPRDKKIPWIFVSWGKFWKGVYLHFSRYTVRFYLWGADRKRRVT